MAIFFDITFGELVWLFNPAVKKGYAKKFHKPLEGVAKSERHYFEFV